MTEGKRVRHDKEKTLGASRDHDAVETDLTTIPGTLFRASQFLSEELPIRLAHRVQELGNLPDQLGDMPSIQRVQEWYAQSFEELTDLPQPELSGETKERLRRASKNNKHAQRTLAETVDNPSIAPANIVRRWIATDGVRPKLLLHGGTTQEPTTGTNGRQRSRITTDVLPTVCRP